MARIPTGTQNPEFLTDEEEVRVRAFVKAIGERHPQLESALTAVCLMHPGLASYLAIGPTVYEGGYELERAAKFEVNAGD